ncbi:MAG: hypothetical protein ACFFDW_11035 [Candidatus Thorarchaeota archaeon]
MYFDNKKIEEIILEYVHNETGWGQPLRPRCEFEDIYVLEITSLENEHLAITFEYHFDEDGFSQYDKNHILNGKLILSMDFNILEAKLEEIHTGVACVEKPYNREKTNKH